MNKIKFAVVGCGHIGKRHVEIISQQEQAELVALIDNRDSVELDVRQYSTSFFSSLENFLHSGIEANVVIIATPNGLHAEHAISCLISGKHVLIEKPMTLNVSEAKKIIDTATQYKKQVFVVMQNRYSPTVAWLKKIIENDVLGKIYLVQINCFWNRDERYYKNDWHGTKNMDGGILFTQFSHFIDIFFWLFGDIKNINARLKTFSHKHLTQFEDSGIVTFEFGENSIGSLGFSTAAWNTNFESNIAIIAENGTVKIGGQYMDKIEYCHIKNYSMPATMTNNNAENLMNHCRVIENVIDVLNNKSAINATSHDGLKVVDIIERIYKASGLHT